jgi:hypothetical protein
MAKAPRATTFSSRSNAKRAAEKAIATGTAPSLDYGIKTRPSGRYLIVWHRKGPEEEASEAAEDPLGYRDRLLAADAARRQTMAEPAEAEEAPPQPEAVEPEADPFPKGTRVLARISKRRQALGTVDYRVDARHVRVHLTAAAPRTPSSMFDVGSLVLATDEDWAAIAPAAKPERKPRAAPSGDRKPSKASELDAAAARGETPTKPIMTSKANPHYQARFDKLEAMAIAGDWDGVRAYEVKGINSYAKMVAAYRDRLLAAHAAQQSKTEAE